MSFRWERLPPMTRVADWNRLAPNDPTGSFLDAYIRKMLPNRFKTYKLQQEDLGNALQELTAAQREQVVSMEPKKTDTAGSSRYIEDIPLHMEVADGEKIVTKYDQEIIELEKAIKIVAGEIRQMERKEAEAFKKDVPDVDKEGDTKACKVENGGNKKTKKKRKKNKANKKVCKTEKEGNLKKRLDADCKKADVVVSDVNMKNENELDDHARKLVADALHAAVKLEAKLIVADVVKNAVMIAEADHEVKMMSAHASVIVDNAIKGAVNTMQAKQKKNGMDATAKEIADDAIRAAVNDMKDEKEKHEMDVRAKVIVNDALKGAVKAMQIETKKKELDTMANGIVDSAIKGAVNVMQMENEKHEMNSKAKYIVDAAIKGVMKADHAKAELDARANEIVDAAIRVAVKSLKAETEENDMAARAKKIVDNAMQYAKNCVKAKHATDGAKGIVNGMLVQRKAGSAINVNDGATEIDAGVDNGNVLGAMLGQNGYDHRRIHVQVAQEKFTEKERTDICQYWSENLGIAAMKNTKLHRDVTYFGRM